LNDIEELAKRLLALRFSPFDGYKRVSQSQMFSINLLVHIHQKRKVATGILTVLFYDTLLGSSSA
jgi:hypothetical protein